jgi:hypothetical protein
MLMAIPIIDVQTAAETAVVKSSPHTAESIVKLVISALETANESVTSVLRSLVEYERRNEFGTFV